MIVHDSKFTSRMKVAQIMDINRQRYQTLRKQKRSKAMVLLVTRTWYRTGSKLLSAAECSIFTLNLQVQLPKPKRTRTGSPRRILSSMDLKLTLMIQATPTRPTLTTHTC